MTSNSSWWTRAHSHIAASTPSAGTLTNVSRSAVCARRLQRTRNLMNDCADVQRLRGGQHLDLVTTAGQAQHEAVQRQLDATTDTAAQRPDRRRDDQYSL